MLTDSERKYYDQLNKDYMTDESDSPDSQLNTVHKHPWRSQRKLMSTCKKFNTLFYNRIKSVD